MTSAQLKTAREALQYARNYIKREWRVGPIRIFRDGVKVRLQATYRIPAHRRTTGYMFAWLDLCIGPRGGVRYGSTRRVGHAVRRQLTGQGLRVDHGSSRR